MKKPGPKPKGKVDTTWRPELAYAIGLLVSDGSLSSDGRHINFTSKDRELVCTFQECLLLNDIKIGKKHSGSSSHKTYYQIQFGDILFYRWLVSLGLTCNKSLSLRNATIPEEYFFDFLRGEWDGDGTIVSNKDMRWKNSYAVSIGFASGSMDFLIWLQEEINTRLKTTGHIHKGKRVLQLRYARRNSKKIFDAMFYKNGLPHLKRKFTKAQKIFKMTGLS